jgi:excisionase family DNA binding protein
MFAMAVAKPQSGKVSQLAGILTLAEAAAYLRVPERDLAELADRNGLPARKIAGEWRFLRRALDDWMRFTGHQPSDYWREHPQWLLESPFAEEFLLLLEERLLQQLRRTVPERPRLGSKQAVLQHFGAFEGDDDLDARLADARKRREEE